MDDGTIMQIKHDRLICSIMFATMCFLTIICLVTLLVNDIFRDEYILLFGVVIVFSLIFHTILAGVFLLKFKKPVGMMRYFLYFFINIYFATFILGLEISIYHLPGHNRQLTILSTAEYFFCMMLFMTLWLYQRQFMERSALTRVITILLSITLLVYTVILIINLSRPILFLITPEGVYAEGIVDIISIVTDFICLLLLGIAAFLSKQSLSHKLSFLICVFVPIFYAVVSINEDTVRWNASAWGPVMITVVLPICLIYFSINDRLEKSVLEAEKEHIKLQVSAMISQMQPHFLYNCLAIIEALCETDPKLAAQATSAFSDYLRENMIFAEKSNPISMSEELNHIKTYVWLEQLRFQNKLNIEYDIKCTSFHLPALSVQPMVENAIKHGVCKDKEGGTVRISTYETDRSYIVTVIDDGTGFDVRKRIDNGKPHLGIENSRYRIREMVGGSLDIKSAPGEGTTVTIRIPKPED